MSHSMYYCICTFLCRSCILNPSLCHLSHFCYPMLLFQGLNVACRNLTLTGSHFLIQCLVHILTKQQLSLHTFSIATEIAKFITIPFPRYELTIHTIPMYRPDMAHHFAYHFSRFCLVRVM